MIPAVVVALKLGLVAAIVVAWLNSRTGRAVRARMPAPPSPLAGYARVAGAVLAAEATLLVIVALP